MALNRLIYETDEEDRESAGKDDVPTGAGRLGNIVAGWKRG
jgi:hypothetical protein